MEYLLGIDGGGSKTALLCLDWEGNTVGQAMVGPTYYRQNGIDNVIEVLQGGIRQCLPAGAEALVCFGMPGYGDSPNDDGMAALEIARAFPHLRMRFVNDVVAGWAGTLALSPGVNLVIGTGSIAYGRDAEGHEARCGGWNALFSDEGSGYWLGRKLLQLFSMESDGRLECTALYHITKKHLGLVQDEDLNSLVDKCYARSRRELASLQQLLLEAANEGDKYALEAYQEAAKFLADIVAGAIHRLHFPDDSVTISCSGGLSNVEALLMEPLRVCLRERLVSVTVHFQRPLLTACEGAVLLALEEFLPERLSDLRAVLLEKNIKGTVL